jgi:hypothetical protein
MTIAINSILGMEIGMLRGRSLLFAKTKCVQMPSGRKFRK